MKIIFSAATCLAGQALLIGCSSLEPVAIADSPSEGKPVYSHVQLVDPVKRLTPEQVGKLEHIAVGNSSDAMRDFVGGLPYGFSGNTEWYPLENDPATWIGLEFSDYGSYKGFRFSFNNEIQQ